MAASIWRILHPGSKCEVFLRSAYHAFNSNSFISRQQIIKAERSYQRWKKIHEERIKMVPPSQKKTPSITFIVRCLPGQEEGGIRTISSIKSQSLGGWKVLIYAAQGWDSSLLEKEISTDRRILFYGESPLSFNQILTKAESGFYLFCDSGDVFSPQFIKMFGLSNAEFPEADIYSTDVEIISDGKNSTKPFFKPTEFSPEFLLSMNYLSRSLIKAEFLMVESLFPCEEFFESEWELLLKASQDSIKITHIPYLLISVNGLMDSKPRNIQKIYFNKYSRSSFMDSAEGNLRRSLSSVKVSIIVPTLNNYHKISKLLDSIVERTAAPDYEIILVDTGSSDRKVITLYDQLKERDNFRIVNYEGEFNYSQAINLGASIASGDLLLFLNNDMQVIEPDWLVELARWAGIPGVGVVGTKLLFSDHRIQHAGVVLGLQGFTGNVYKNAPEHYFGFTGSLDWTRNLSAVSGACQMIRKGVFEELDGYDPNYQIVFGDVDLCLRAIQNGYRVVYAPGAAMFHYEGRTRGYLTPVKDMINGYEKMEHWIEVGDPMFSPHLTYSTIPACDLISDPNASRLKNILDRRAYLRNSIKKH